MPVLLTREEDFETWLKGPLEAALGLARSHPAQEMQIVQEGPEKEDLLELPPPSTQTAHGDGSANLGEARGGR
jgi:putative SOS response-associated peptidase YedK